MIQKMIQIQILIACFMLSMLNVSDGNILVYRPEALDTEKTGIVNAAKHCVCVDFNCGCCSHLVEKKIKLDATICANATYLKQDYGFALTVTFNKYTIFNSTMSLRNPPPICIGAPYLEDMADLCVRIYDIQAAKQHLHACVDVEAHLKHIHIAKWDLGCFDMRGDSLTKAIEQMTNEV